MRKFLVNILLTLTSVGLVYLVAELLLFPLLLPHLPQNLFNAMSREPRVLGQSSKQGLLPAPGYLAIAGDSYAQGKGDWFIDNGYNRGSRFHTPHLLQDALGVDCVSFGRSGAGSVDGLLLEPLQILRFLNRHGLDMPEPGQMLLFFYEGNDIEDNRKFVSNHYEPVMGTAAVGRLGDADEFRFFLDNMEKDYADGNWRETGDRAMLGGMLLRFLRDTVYYRLTRSVVEADPLREPGAVNRVRLASGIAPVPDKLQGPPVEASPEWIDRGLFLFEQSALALRRALPNTRMHIVYIPSPAACYDWRGQTVSMEREEQPVDKALIFLCSDQMAERLRAFAAANGFGFADTRSELRRTATTALLHGPRDWDHFNRVGYEAFTRAILDSLGPQLLPAVTPETQQQARAATED